MFYWHLNGKFSFQRTSNDGMEIYLFEGKKNGEQSIFCATIGNLLRGFSGKLIVFLLLYFWLEIYGLSGRKRFLYFLFLFKFQIDFSVVALKTIVLFFYCLIRFFLRFRIERKWTDFEVPRFQEDFHFKMSWLYYYIA